MNFKIFFHNIFCIDGLKWSWEWADGRISAKKGMFLYGGGTISSVF